MPSPDPAQPGTAELDAHCRAASPDPLAVRAALPRPGGLFEIRDEDVRGARLSVFGNRMGSLREMLAASGRFGDRTYVIDGGTRLSFAEHLRLTDKEGLPEP